MKRFKAARRAGGRRRRPHVNHSPGCRTILIWKKQIKKNRITVIFCPCRSSSREGRAKGTALDRSYGNICAV